MHRTAVNAVQLLDGDVVGGVRHWLAGSQTTADRLRRYWSIPDDKISPYRHPALGAGERATHRADPTSIAMVSRHEWPKRTELAVAAIHHATAATSLEAIGGGSRLPFVADLDVRLARGDQLSDDDLWLNRGPSTAGWLPAEGDGSGRLSLYGEINNDSRNALINNAAAIVAPAYNEDYGLTALEAFAAAKPLIVCHDGGGLTEFVTNEVTGLVVDPTPEALADAMDRLVRDRRLAQRLADSGYEHGQTFTIDAALDQFESGLNQLR
ncbi:MAG: glycosyltransferase family 4 protein [Acidimicrobiales bacterium]